MKQFIKHTPYLMSLLMLLGITSCTKMDEYLKYTDGKEILYTGIPDSIAMYPATTGWSSAEYWHPTLK